jgi:hypothetical protein
MTTIDIEPGKWDEHLGTHTDALREHGHLWRMAIERSGTFNEITIAALLQVCAACYLDGVSKGSLIGMTMFAEKKGARY